jgi:nucleoid-associated protein YgaU
VREPDARDWGLAPAEPRASWKAKACWTAAVLALAALGYFGYATFLAAPTNAVSDEAPESLVAEHGALEPDDVQADPFDTAPLVTPRRSVEPADHRAVRHAQDSRPAAAPPAAPAILGPQEGRKSARAEPTLQLPDDDDELLADDDDLADVSNLEPSEPSAEETSMPPLLRPTPGAGPTLELRRDNRATPPMQVGAASAEELEDFELDDEPQATRDGTAAPRARPEPWAEELDGYEADELASHRAVSRTLVTSAAESARLPSSLGGGRFKYRSGDEPENEDASFTARSPARLSGTTATASNPRHSDRGGSGSLGPRDELYTVAPNDNYWTISRRLYGTSRYYAALTRHNQDRIPDPQRLRPGMLVATPPAAVLEQRYPESIEKSARAASPAAGTAREAGDGKPWFGPPAAPRNASRAPRETEKAGGSGYFYGRAGEPLYRIGPDDTLGSIAQKHLGRFSRWHELYEQNRDVLKSPDNLTVGTVIRLPLDSSRVGVVPEAERGR